MMRGWRWWAIGYAALVSFVVWWMLAARERAVTELASPQSVARWEDWREEVRQQQTEPGPVQRRVPKSAEPPALVLMRDYFAVALVGAVLFSTVLYWVTAWFIAGALAGGRK